MNLASLTSAGFVPVRLDAPDLLGTPSGRREGHHLSALSVGLDLAEDVNWRTNTIGAFCSVAWARAHRVPWRRARRAFAALDHAGVAHIELQRFRPGSATITARSEPTSLLHDRARPGERFAPFTRGALLRLSEEHDLSWVARALLRVLVVTCDHNSGELAEGQWTKTLLCARFGIGWRRLSAALEALARAGLISYTVRRGGTMTLTLLAQAALVAPVAPPQPRRSTRRRITQEATSGTGPSADLATKLLAHHGLRGTTPSPALLRALGDGLATGATEKTILERLAARGALGGAADPMAVLVTRARQVKGEIVAAQEEAERRRAAQQADTRRLEALEAEQAHQRATTAAQDRWLASALERIPSGSELGLAPQLLERPVALAAHIHSAAKAVVAHWPDLDPVELARRWAAHPCAPEALDTSGIGPREIGSQGPPGHLPHARAGPRLIERLRTEHR